MYVADRIFGGNIPPPPMTFDDSASFLIARSVKLGYGESSHSPAQGKGTKAVDFATCSSDNQCLTTQKCVKGQCKNVCTSTTCKGETPSCEAKDHAATCKCSETSCGAGKQCAGGKCETCAVGSKCNCDGEKVIDAAGKCVCPPSVSCAAGQYVSGDCSCKNCMENDTSGNKCGCSGNTVPDGSGSCYCKTPKTCGEGYSFDKTNSCECVPCTDNNSCDNPCPAGSFPNGSGCGTYACMDDSNCGAGNRCENGGTESAQCVPCGKNEACNCPDGQLSDGSGNCGSVTCKTGLICDGSTTEQCCEAGMQCVNPDSVDSYCTICETDTQCTCPAGYVVNSSGKCVKPDCAKNSDCANGSKCENAGKSNATCTPCTKGETCTCTGGMVADGNGGCEFGCEFSSASACKSGTANCSNCSMTGGCYVCSSCGTGYELSGGSCSPKACPTGYSTSTTSCDAGYALETNGSSGGNACGKCVAASCPTGYSTSTTSCGTGYTLETNGSSGGNACGKCVAASCPSGYSTSTTSCGSQQALETKGMSGEKDCGKCVDVSCPSDKPAWDGSKCVQCTGNIHCPDYKYCKNNVCVLAAGRCETGSDCKSASDGCVSHSCVPLCQTETCTGKTPKCYISDHKLIGCECSGNSCGTGYECRSKAPLNECVSLGCSSDSDCVSSKKCVSGQCVDACSGVSCPERTPQCYAYNHTYGCECSGNSCGTGYECRSKAPLNECVKLGCSSDSDCVDSKKCVNGECVSACSGVTCSGTTPKCYAYNHTYGCECSSSSCPSGQYCKIQAPLSKCVTGTVGEVETTEKCTTNDDCSAEKTCSNGYCVFKD